MDNETRELARAALHAVLVQEGGPDGDPIKEFLAEHGSKLNYREKNIILVVQRTADGFSAAYRKALELLGR